MLVCSFVLCFVLRAYNTSTVLTFNFPLDVFFLICLSVFFVLFIINLCLLLYLFFVCFSIP